MSKISEPLSRDTITDAYFAEIFVRWSKKPQLVNDWESAFLESLKTQWVSKVREKKKLLLSEKQEAVLRRIEQKLWAD